MVYLWNKHSAKPMTRLKGSHGPVAFVCNEDIWNLRIHICTSCMIHNSKGWKSKETVGTQENWPEKLWAPVEKDPQRQRWQAAYPCSKWVMLFGLWMEQYNLQPANSCVPILQSIFITNLELHKPPLPDLTLFQTHQIATSNQCLLCCCKYNRLSWCWVSAKKILNPQRASNINTGHINFEVLELWPPEKKVEVFN